MLSFGFQSTTIRSSIHATNRFVMCAIARSHSSLLKSNAHHRPHTPHSIARVAGVSPHIAMPYRTVEHRYFRSKIFGAQPKFVASAFCAWFEQAPTGLSCDVFLFIIVNFTTLLEWKNVCCVVWSHRVARSRSLHWKPHATRACTFRRN